MSLIKKIVQIINIWDHRRVGVTSLAEDVKGNIWVATRESGISIFNGVTKRVIATISMTSPKIAVHHLLSDKDGTMWISTSAGLFRSSASNYKADPEKVELVSNDGNFTNEVVTCALIDHQKKLWIGTPNGLLLGEPKGKIFRHYTQDPNNPHSLSDRYILCIYQDHNHVIWIGTYNGVNKFVYSSPAHISYTSDVTDRSKSLRVVRSLYTDNDSLVFVGTVNALCLFDRRTETLQYIKDETGKDLKNVFSVIRDHQGQLWCGNSNGFQKIVRHADGFVCETADEYPELALFRQAEVTQCVHLSGDTYLLATLNNDGLYRWNRKKHSIKNLQSGHKVLRGNRINHIYKSETGVIWIATNAGVSRFDGFDNKMLNFNPAGNEQSDPGLQIVNAIAEIEGILWLATDGGLIRFDPVNLKTKIFTEDDGLPNHNLYCCIRANDSTLWMSSNKGISKFNVLNQEFTNYDVSDGLQSNEYNRFAWHQSNSGKLYFGGMEGFDVFSATGSGPLSASIAITGIRIIRKNSFTPLSPALKRPELHYSQNAIGFAYAPLQFGFPQRHEYLCRLDGLDKEWIDNSESTTISYTNLPPGTYLFNVKLKTGRSPITSYAFTIQAPFWQTKWFYLLIIITILFIVVLLIRTYYRRKMERQRLVFERQKAIELERTRIATDIHDDLGAGLSRIRFLSDTITIKTEQHQSIQDDIIKIKAYAHEMIEKMGEIVWALNQKNDSLSDLLSYLRAYSAEYLSQHNILCHISTPDDIPELSVSGEFRRNIFLTVKEALHNVVKHSQSHHAAIEIKITDALIIVIEDNGKGFNLNEVKPHRNGLSNMKKRMQDIGGELQIKNHYGTSVKLTAPLSI